MSVKQISVFLENKSGRLAEVTEVLGKKNIGIIALSIADTSDFGILRLIVSQPDEALRVLREAGFAVSVIDVLAVAIADTKGSLAKVLAVLADNNIGIEYMYAFCSKLDNMALAVLKVGDLENTGNILGKNGFKILSQSDVFLD
jgi:hypothetical protein